MQYMATSRDEERDLQQSKASERTGKAYSDTVDRGSMIRVETIFGKRNLFLIGSLLLITSCSKPRINDIIPESEKATLHLLYPRHQHLTQHTFPTFWRFSGKRDVILSKTFDGGAAKEIISSLRSNLRNKEAKNDCGHEPIYGVEIKGNNKEFKATICFNCGTWAQNGDRKDISLSRAPTLQEPLEKHLPIPHKILTKEFMKSDLPRNELLQEESIRKSPRYP